ncbi:hypothetical protein ANCCAN_11641 [Ancylostoma caninum]|uniref:Protein regulator of cytokinesis 1 n=1 Tax=Ancylostoma caninum TaxID=29170 RepID=A0A368GHQ7_ANCCA|nr:hypothetical protein ANCCAN_11641 [Ancylostoma caninum]
MSESARVTRVGVAFGHITKLLSDMVASEENMVAAVASDIENGLNRIDRMRSQLGMEPWENRKAPPGSVELLKSIESEIKKLRPLYETRQLEQEQLIEQLNQLLYRLGIEEENPARMCDDELLPTEKMRALEARRLRYDDMLQKRVRQALKWQKDMKKFEVVVGRSVDPDDQNIHTILNLDFTKDDVCLSEAMMNSIESCYTQLLEMYSEHVQEKEFRWMELHTRLAELWELCHVADIERMIPSSYDPEKHTEKDFERMATEISRLECLYEARKEVFDILTQWKSKWAEKMAIEEKKKSAEYFQNRGRENNVFLDAKIERTLSEFTLPKLLKSLIVAYDNYRESHPGDDIRVDGFTPPDYVKWVIDEYNASKEVERKTRQMQRNLVSTSALRTPQSSRGKLPQRPVSSSKLEPLRKRLRYDSLSTLSPCFNSTSVSSIPSMITPTKRIKGGPKHSSPKHSSPIVKSAGKRKSTHSITKTPRLTRSPFRLRNKLH